MDLHVKQHARSIAALTGLLAIISLGQTSVHNSTGSASNMYEGWTARVGSTWTFARFQKQKYPNQPEYRVAQRLQARLRKRGDRSAPELSVLAAAVKSRQSLLSKHIDVEFATEEHPVFTVWSVSAQRYPLWLQPVIGLKDAKFVLSSEQIAKTLEKEEILKVDAPVHAILRSVEWKEEGKRWSSSRGELEGTAKGGYLPNYDLISASVAKAFHSDLDSISIPLEKEHGRVINLTGEDMGDLKLWATGRSNYKGSTIARKFNVQKALNEHVQNSVVRPGEMFSFNSTLDGPVSVGNGWRMAKVIFNGGDLEPAPGGGICQASTTVFRAVVNAGFPVVERRSHSLYVSYYKKHGVGIDATIYPGSQDLVFLNDTDNHLVIQAYNEGDEAIVNIYGTPDGRTVELKGPFFASTAPNGFTYKGRKMSHNEIVWVQQVQYPDGAIKDYEIGSRYKTLPQSIANEYAQPETTVHTSAPLASLEELSPLD